MEIVGVRAKTSQEERMRYSGRVLLKPGTAEVLRTVARYRGWTLDTLVQRMLREWIPAHTDLILQWDGAPAPRGTPNVYDPQGAVAPAPPIPETVAPPAVPPTVVEREVALHGLEEAAREQIRPSATDLAAMNEPPAEPAPPPEVTPADRLAMLFRDVCPGADLDELDAAALDQIRRSAERLARDGEDVDEIVERWIGAYAIDSAATQRRPAEMLIRLHLYAT